MLSLLFSEARLYRRQIKKGREALRDLDICLPGRTTYDRISRPGYSRAARRSRALPVRCGRRGAR